MDQNPVLRLPPPYRHQQRLQYDICGLTALHRPSQSTTRKEVDHDGKIGKAFQCPNVGDVCHTDPGGLLHIELPVEAVVKDHGRSSAITARPTPISDLGLDPSQSGKTRDTVQVTRFSLIKQIVMKLAISIDLTALLPGLAQQFSLTDVFPRPFAQRILQPGVKAAWIDVQTAAHRSHRGHGAMLGDERVPHLASLAKYAVAFFFGCLVPR